MLFSGWGFQSSGAEDSDLLHVIPVSVVSSSECVAVYGNSFKACCMLCVQLTDTGAACRVSLHDDVSLCHSHEWYIIDLVSFSELLVVLHYVKYPTNTEEYKRVSLGAS